MTKTLRERIEEILISYFVDKDKDNHWGTIERTDQLLSLFTQEMEKVLGETGIPTRGMLDSSDDWIDGYKEGRNDLRTEQLKKVRGVRK